MPRLIRGKRRPEKAREPYGQQGRGQHDTLRAGDVTHPRWTRKLIRMITRVFR